MARPTTRNNSNGDKQVLYQLEHSKGITGNRSSKGNKKPLKSNVTNKVKTRHQDNQSIEEEGEGQDDDADSSALDEQKGSAEEPDVYALSGAQQHVVGEDKMRLAGSKIEVNEIFNETSVTNDDQAVAGAELYDNGSDNGYGNVEDVSESEASDDDEDDEHSILRSAEKDLIDEFERTEQRRDANIMTIDMNEMAIDDAEAVAQQFSLHAPATPNLDITGHDYNFAINMDEDPFFGLSKDDNLYDDMWTEAESEIWRMPETVRNRQNSDSNGTQKRVRFEEIQSRDASITASEEDPNESFPDLFAASDDPAVKRRLAVALSQDAEFFDDGASFYDFEDEDEKLAFQIDESSDSEYDSSTYDSDEGDETDEESREEQIARLEERKKAAGVPTDSAPNTPSMSKRQISTADLTPLTPRPMTPKSGKGPVSGTFAIDPTRATMTTEAGGRKIKLLPPTKPQEKDRAFWDRARTANNSRNHSPPDSAYLTLPSPGADNLPPQPLTAKSTLGSMFDGNLDILCNNDSSGIAEDLFPAMMMAQRQTSFNTTTTEDSDIDHQDINMQDFVDLQESESDSDRPPSASLTSPTESDFIISLNSSGLLDHFDQYRGAVGSFRRNQHQAKHFSSLPSNPTKRASMHEYNALQRGKRGAANTPITPARKKRASQDLSGMSAGVRKSVSSPLTSRRPRSRGNSLVGIANADLLQTLARNPFE